MPYLAVQYSGSTRPYTFYTSRNDHQVGEQVLVKDKNGFKLCAVVGYVKRPSFPCAVVVASQHEMEEKASYVQDDMTTEEGGPIPGRMDEEDGPNMNEEGDK